MPKYYLALSCLQGRPMQAAFEDLSTLAPDGIQLTPGCAPTLGFSEFIRQQPLPLRTHHGFCYQALRQPVWSRGGDLLSQADSIHPPRLKDLNHGAEQRFWYQMTHLGERAPILETMYSGYILGSGPEILRAMEMKLPLAIDVSHIYIQLCQGTITKKHWAAVRNYSNIREVHVSANDGKRDLHRSLREDSFGLEWAKSYSGPVILENYCHRLSTAERLTQLAILREKSPELSQN